MIQLLDLLNNKITDLYLEKIYYFCCIIGGIESIDYFLHKIVEKISKSIKINLIYYSYKKFSFIDILNKTKNNIIYYSKDEIKIFQNFINNIKNNNIKNKHCELNNDIIELYDKSLNLRGFNQHINFNKVYCGNFNVFGRVNNYYINQKDIDLLNKIKEIHKSNYKNALKCYFQIFQMFHMNKLFWYNHQSIIIKNNICIDHKKYKHNCKSRQDKYISNISVALQNYGDCREINFIMNLYLLIDEFDIFMKYFNQNNFNKIKKIILNQKRLFSVKTYIDGHLEKIFPDKNYFIYNNNKITSKSILNNYEKKHCTIINNKRVIKLENHNLIFKFTINDNSYKIIIEDLLYDNSNLMFDQNNIYDSLFCSDYILNGQEIKFYKKYLDFGYNIFNKKVVQYAKFDKMFFLKSYLHKNPKNKLIYLSKPFTFHNKFFNINKFILNREVRIYHNRKKYFYIDKKVFRYKKNINNRKLKYFLLEDFII